MRVLLRAHARARLPLQPQLYELNLSHNKFARPGLMRLAKCLASNSGLITLDLTGHRINSEVAVAFVEAFQTNMTLCKLIWKLEARRRRRACRRAYVTLRMPPCICDVAHDAVHM